MTVTMMVTEMYASITVAHHSLQNMTMTMTAGVIKKNVALTMIKPPPLMKLPLEM